MEIIRKNAPLLSFFFSIVMCFFVGGVYAKTVRINEENIHKIEVEYKEEVSRINKVLDAHTKGIATAIIEAKNATKASELCIASNNKVEAIMMELRTKLASIETDISWIKEVLKNPKRKD